jgi:hypothetical protein
MDQNYSHTMIPSKLFIAPHIKLGKESTSVRGCLIPGPNGSLFAYEIMPKPLVSLRDLQRALRLH